MQHGFSALIADYKAGRISGDTVRDLLERTRRGERPQELSEGQRGLWALQRSYPGSSAYNVPMSFRVSGLDTAVLREACRAVVREHPVLSTVIHSSEGVPFQSVDPERPLDFSHRYLAEDEEMPDALRREKELPFEIEGGSLLRVRVLERAGDEAVVLVVVHHIVFDGGSARILADSLFGAYQALLEGGDAPGPERAEVVFHDFVRRERRRLVETHSSALAHWRDRLDGPLPLLTLPTERPHSRVRNPFAGATHSNDLPEELAARVAGLADARHGYVSAMLLGAFAATLATYSRESGIVVGMPVDERDGAESDQAVGLMITMMPVLIGLAEDTPFRALVERTQREVLDGMFHGYPLPALVRELGAERREHRSPLFQTAFVYQDVLDGIDGPDRPYQYLDEPHQEGEYELSLEVWRRGAGFRLHWKYHPELFSRDFVTRLGERFLRLLDHVTTRPETTVGELRRRFGGGEAPRVHEMIRETARRRPEAVAVSDARGSLTYRELDLRSRGLAARLSERGVGPGDLVAVLMERSSDVVVTFLGVLRAGAAFLPLDPELPAERLVDILEDSRARLVLTQRPTEASARELLDRLPEGTSDAPRAEVVVLDGGWTDPVGDGAGTPEVEVTGDDLAYVIYTSGSTGRPKGVMVPHRGLGNLLRSMAERPGMSADDTLFAVTTTSFDMAQVELFLPLVTGARCHVCDSATIRDVELLKNRISAVRPTVMQATPALWSMLFHSGWRNAECLRAFTGGEALSRTLKEHFLDSGTEVWNLYGPTEATVYATGTLVRREAPITIGTPVADARIHILDERLRPVPSGETGELCIAGPGVATGYLNRPELTAERFVRDPFAPEGRMYRTGDLARWNEDGEIDYLGRMDFQVKIRGHRVELGDIEYHLGRHEDVAACVVVAPGEDTVRQLVAYYTPERPGGAEQGARWFRDFLRDKLPEYMVPAHFVPIDTIPLTGSGKVDRGALTRREIVVADTGAVPGAGSLADVEAEVLECWRDVLGISGAGPTASFFDLGGSSLSAVMLAERISQRLDVPFAAPDLFRYTTARAVARYAHDARSRGTAEGPAPSGGTEPATGSGTATSREPRRPTVPEDAIAVVGVSCRFPDAEDHREFWRNLTRGKRATGLWTEDELRGAGVPERLLENPSFVPLRSCLDRKDSFDGEFFRLSPRHVALMDPQFRQLLVHAWKAVEDAGYDHRDLPGTGVYVSSGNHFYGAPADGDGSPRGVIEDPEQYLSWVMCQGGTIASMISHQLGFGGPSMSVHSNCSSSLSALSLAVRAIQSGETDQALVAAASVSRHDGLGYVYQPGLNFSGDGRLKAFDADADGMVAGEGVVAFLVRRARDAVADGDHVYALVRGAATNNDGGQATGFYTPSVEGQSRVIREALERTGVDPASIGYVEAHGTGTKLGDPVELTALTDAYRTFTEEVGYCGIGSVKSNLGHLDTAAGLAGSLKAVLSLHHRQLPPTINHTAPNPQLRLDGSPFHVVDRLTDWFAGPTPRRAAQSSIGLGGSNAHAVFEEYEGDTVRDVEDDGCEHVVPLSARGRDNLTRYARDLLDHLGDRDTRSAPTPLRLRDLAYTLQVGRVPMEYRVAFVVRDLDELEAELSLFVRGDASARRHVGRVPATDRSGGSAPPARRTEGGGAEELAWAWTRGDEVVWRALPRSQECRRTSLPSYPFSDVRHPWPGSGHPGKAAVGADARPPVRASLPGDGERGHRTRFTGDEYLLRDHVVDGRAILPATAALDMVHTRVGRTVPGADGRVTLRNVTWLRPLEVGPGGREVELSLSPAAGDGTDVPPGPLTFTLASREEGGDRVHVQGRVETGAVPAAPDVDLERLRSVLGARPVTGEECYGRIARMGVRYGPGFRLVHTLLRGVREGRREVLAELRLPEGLRGSLEEHTLHPSVLDAAIHASLGLDPSLDTSAASADGEAATAVPFALDELTAHGPIEEVMYSWVRPAAGRGGDGTVLDVDLVDGRGRVRVAMRGLAYREVGTRPAAEGADRYSRLHTLVPVWEPRNADRRRGAGVLAPVADARAAEGRVLVFGSAERLRGGIGDPPPGYREVRLRPEATVEEIAELIGEPSNTEPLAHVLWVAPEEAPSSEGFTGASSGQERGVIEVFRIVKALLGLGYGTRALEWTAVTFGTQRVREGERVAATHASVHGLMGSLAKEHTRWTVRAVDLPRDGEPGSFGAGAPPTPPKPGATLALRNGRWFSQELLRVPHARPGAEPYRHRGVYVVVGGAGGIGELWSRHMVERYQASIVWIGRRPLEGAVERGLAGLAELAENRGARPPLYLSADASDLGSLRAARRRIREHHPRLDGVVHSAIVLADRVLGNMDEDEFRAALTSKTDVGANLAEVFGADAPDLVLFFSSVESFAREAGQANYAAGCTFKDALARELRQRWRDASPDSERPPPVVKTINWGYWGAAGVVSDSFYRERLAEAGVDSLDPEEAFRHLAAFLSDDHDQAVLMRTFGDRALRGLALDERLHREPACLPSVIDEAERGYGASPGDLERLRRHLPDERMCDLAVQLLFATLRDLGPDDLERRVPARLHRWLEESDRLLARSGSVEVVDGRRVFLERGAPHEELWRRWHAERERWRTSTSQAARVDLVESCLLALPDVLTGRRQATEVLFPDSSTSLVEGVYRDDPIAEHFNDQLASLVDSAVRAWLRDDPTRRVRVLEVGAGTGATTTKVLAALDALGSPVEEYCYTDVSKAFLFRAEERLGDRYPYLTTRLFDVEHPPGPQGVDPGAFDVVVATNVLHATSDVSRTLRNVKAAMRANGLLFVNEMSGNTVLAHLTVGLLDGWWAHEDDALRIEGSPVLGSDGWREVLSDEGFGRVRQPGVEAHDLGQQLVIAESDGAVRAPLDTGAPTGERVPNERSGDPVGRGGHGTAPEEERDGGTGTDTELRERTEAYFRDLVSRTLRLDADLIALDEDLHDRGLDSILVSGMNNALAADFDEVGSTLFFELRSLGELVDHFVRTRRPELARQFGLDGPRTDRPTLRARATAYLTDLAATTLRLAPDGLAPDTNLFDQGLDSILVVQMNNELGRVFDDLDNSLFFDHPTVGELVDHFVATRRERLEEVLGGGSPRDRSAAERTPPPAPERRSEVRPRPEPEPAGGPATAARREGRVRDIAVVGVAGRYPGAENPQELWDNLCRGTDSTAPYPEDRWWCRWDADTRPTGGFVRDAACFDAEYFGLTGDEAAAMGPQERLFVETVHSAVQDSGHTTAGLNEQGRVGVFVGVMNSTYNGRTAHSSIANRTSHLFDFQGSSVAVDTACSSSLTAVHMALESLYSGDNDCVVAGGVNLLLDQDHFRVLEEHGLLSRSGRCRPFSEHADGFLAAEAVGVVVLRPLEDALASGNHVHAVIKGSAVNAGGRSGRYGTPSLRAQRDVVARAMEKAGTPPSTISYVETHGTATQLGDSIEISALAQAFGEEGPRTGGNCSVGSVKSNLGHCESASGVVGLTKVLMQFRYGRIAPSINAEELNSGIVFRRTPFSVRRELVRWEPVDDQGRPVPRRAGVSCFGAGGSNAHLVVEEYTGTPGPEEERHGGPHLVPLSARTPEQLRESALLLADHLDRVAGTPHEAPLRDVAYTLQVGRDALPHRMLLTVSSTGRLSSELRRFAASGEAEARTEPDGEVRDPAPRWLDGGSVDWQELWRTSRPRRTSLPTYPFTRTKHWYRSGEAAAVAPVPEPRTRGVQAPSHWGEADSETRLRAWLRDVLAAELAADPQDLDTTESLPALGLSSRSLVRVAREIQSGPDPDFDAASLFEYDTVDRLADHLAGRGAVVADRGERADAAGERRGAEPSSHTLSQAQQGLWALQREAPGSSAYNVPLCFRVTDLDVRALSEAFTAVRARHGVLAGAVRVERGALVLRRSPEAEPALEERHLSPMTRDEVFGLVREHAKEPFDLEHGPLCRISVFHLSDGTAWVLVNAHHLVLDGVSAMVLLKDLLAHYRAFTGGGAPDAAAPEAAYAEFVTAEEAGMRGEEGAARLEYWRNRLSSPLPALALPPDRPRSLADRDARGATETWRLTEELGVRIDRFTHDHGVYGSAVFLAAFKTLLHRHTQQDDVIVGTAVNTRPDRRFDGTVGHFVDMVPVRSRVRREAPFLELCREVQATLTSGVARAYPFTALVRELGLSTVDGGSPVFGNAFIYQDWYEDVTGGAGEFEYVEGIHQEGEYELVLEVVEPADDLTTYSVRWKYRPDLFDGETVRNLGRQYLRLLEEVLARPHLAVGEAPLISDEEWRTLTVEWNDTAASHPSLHVHELVSEQAARVPEATALVFGGDSLTYRELDDRARRLAVYLETLGVRPGARVAVYMERSFDLVVALLATMRAGCAYVPLDPSHPRSRITHILDDAAAEVVLSQAALRDRVATLTQEDAASGAPRVVLVDEDWSGIAATAGAHRDVTDRVTGTDPAYVIYTSGSTGAPKGVVVPHRALTNFLCSMARRPGLRPSDRVLAVTTHSFDIAALEIYLPLVTGALCHLCDGDTARDPDRLRRMIGEVRPSLMQGTPSTWTMLLHAGWTNDERMTVLCGGEPMPETLKDRLVASGAEVWNMFGPTETTVWSTLERVEAHRGVTIGLPIDNTQVHILDERGELVPTGAPGELCIAGEGVALGYLNKPELTAERFRDNPFPPGGKLYRTGDLARWRGDGSIECLGRIDSQVKIRGFRVELGEIEHVLATHPAVAECVAQAREQSGTQQLVVHYTPVDGHGADTGELRRYLAGRLPDYMVPAFLVPVERMPRTPNGKVDREALAELGVTRHAGTPERARRPEPAPEREDVPEEGDVLALWREVLGADDLTPTDAFLDAGGSSVLAAVLAEQVSERYGTPFTSAEVFTGVNARGMAEHLRAERARVDGSGRDHEGSGVDTAEGLPGSSVDGVAIIGVSCRLPGAEDHQEFWARLLTGGESVEVLSRDELRRAGVDERLAEDPAFVPVRASMRGKGDFDADFFRISARDAELMDPQSRLLLQHSWKAVEDAAYLPEDVADAAVYVSTSNMLYQAPLRTDGAARDSEALVGFLHAQPGTIPTTISHKLGLHGPSLFVHSNCSSSLAGLALAFQAIRSGQTTHALVGGAGMYGERPVGYVYEEGMTLSSNGHCAPFSDDATGMVGGEGVVMFLLKDARAAVRDGDHVYAVIRGVGMNNDGAEKAGYYAPGAAGQTEVISSVLERTGVDPETIRYVEAHGTGTRIGDPIEVGALSAAFRRYTDARGFCGIGSVKSNLGHLDAAAGLAGCLKAALALGERRVPPTINHREPNPQIDFEGSPFYVVTELTELAPSSGPLRAGVSSFGIGGTNVHALLEEPPAPEGADDGEPSGPHLVPLSAQGLPNLRRYARDLARRISGDDRPRGRALRIADVAHTLRVGRTPMAERVAFVVDGVDELVHALDDFADGGGGERCFRPGSAEFPSPSNEGDQRDLARRWMAEDRLDEVARLWVEGGHVDWRDLRVGAHRPRRVPLPTYPFSEEYHWLPERPARRVADAPSGDGRGSDAVELRYFEEYWSPEPAAGVAEARGVVVCFLTGEEERDAFRRSVPEHAGNARLVFVERAGRGDAETSATPADGVYRVGSRDEAGLRRTLDMVAEEHGAVGAIHYLWPLEYGGDTVPRVLADLAPLVRALAASALEVTDLLVAGHFHDAVGQAALDAVIGYERSLGSVLPGTATRVVLHEGTATPARWAALLFTEQCQERRVSVMYRGERRYVCATRRLEAGVRRAPAVSPRRGATYLVTGAFGGLGRRVSEYLAETYGADLVLVGRSPSGAADRAWVEALRAHGGRVESWTLDVTDERALAERLTALPPERAVSGVFHLAGAAQASSLTDRAQGAFEAVLAAKVQGTLAVERAFERASGHRPPDFVCHFSSVAATLGDFGGCDYAAANRFQAAYARALRERHPSSRTIALEWPLWEEGGLGAAAHQEADGDFTRAYLAATGQRPLDTATGMRAMEEVLASGHANPIVLQARSGSAEAILERAVGIGGGAVTVGARTPESDDAPAEPRARRKDLTGELRAVARHVLGVSEEKLDDQSNFTDLGLDSIRLTQFAHRASAHLGVDVSPTELYDHPTIRELVDHLADRVADGVGEPASDGGGAPVAVARPVDAPIAITGMSGIFPGCRSVDEFWDALAEGRDMVRELTGERFAPEPSTGEDGGKPGYRWMGTVDWADEFDPTFFEIAPKEARTMDPRQRHLLQECWRALEDAGLGREELGRHRVGVFVGVEQGDYQLLVGGDGNLTSNHDGVLAARLSYFLDLDGPALAVNTACSSGLVALHQAIASLRQGDCDVAVVAAANFVLTQESLAAMERAGMLSAEGRCRAFDQRADGMVPGEAVTALVLRPLDRAEESGDPIHSVVMASGTNYDGRTNGITAPAGAAQRALVESVHERAGVDVEDIGYVVAHGTGTRLGDPVEVNALRDAFRTGTDRSGFCALTSPKTNIGHTFAASGLVGLVCLSESVRRGVIPPSLHCEEDNEYIDWDRSPLYVNKETRRWETPTGGPRTGGVSAFGMSGTNAHVILREYVSRPPASTDEGPRPHLLPLSTKDGAALERLVDAMIARVEDGSLTDADLCRMSETLFTGRHHFRHRLAVVAGTLTEAADRWRRWRAAGAAESGAPHLSGTVARGFDPDDSDTERIEELVARVSDTGLDGAERERILNTLAEYYVRGHAVPWRRTRDTRGRAARLRLPTYPFARNRYWVRSRTGVDGVRDAGTKTERDEPRNHTADGRVVLVRPEDCPERIVGRPLDQRPPVRLTVLPEPVVDGDRDVLVDLKAAAGAEFDGMVATLNRTGVMVEHLIPYSSDFAEYAGECGGEVLDLGCAYGVATVAALERGARVVALDMERKHLDILEQRLTDGARKRLTTMRGLLPDVDFPDGRFGAVHAGRVLHFLSPEDVRLTLRKMMRWLEPGGKVFLSTDSPYFGYWASRAAEYERRKRDGDPWPGHIDDVAAHFPAEHVVGGPNLINALDPDVFRRECEAAGFVVERAGFFGAVGSGQQAHGAPGPGMEHVGVIARRPEDPPRKADLPRSRDGNDLHHRRRGSGRTALVFVHGLGCDGEYWHHQVRHFEDRHTVVTLDLAGHGRSGRDRNRWTVEEFAHDVAAVVNHVGVDEVVLVGHSLGGPVMLEAAPLLAAEVRGMIGVDTLHDLAPRPLSPERLDRFVRSFADRPVEAEELFPGTARRDLVELVRRTRAHTGAEVISSAFREMLIHLRALPDRFAAPLTLVNSTSWMPTNLDAARARGAEVELVTGVGHFPMLEDPDALNAVLQRHIDRMEAGEK